LGDYLWRARRPDSAEQFLEHCLLTEEGLTAMNKAKPIGIPALIPLYQEMAKDNPLLQALKVSVDHGQVMPNIPQMGRFFSSVGAALEIAINGQLSPQAALREAQANMLHR
jgi:maltose/maltodextrin transport system substrate-binding protein